MAKPTKWTSSEKEFSSLLRGISKPILEQWKNGASELSCPPWAPKPNHVRVYDDVELSYLAKIKALSEMFKHVYNRNLKLKYRLNAVAKEIKCLKRVKRVLCRRLFEHNSKELVGTYLEIPDNDTSMMVVMDQIIGDVVSTATQAKTTPTPLVKKKRKEQKLLQTMKPNNSTSNSTHSREDEIQQHIISVIDNVAHTDYDISNGPTPSKKSRKQNLAALTSPTKDTLPFSNGVTPNNSTHIASNSGMLVNNNTFVAQTSPLKTVKLEMSANSANSSMKTALSTVVIQNKEFSNPTHLPIYVKRELIYPPEKRESKPSAITSNTLITSSIYSIQPASTSTMLSTPSHSIVQLSPSTATNKTESFNAVAIQTRACPATKVTAAASSSSTSIVTSKPADSSLHTGFKIFYPSKTKDDRSPVYSTSALTRENLKTLTQSRLSNNNQLSQEPEDPKMKAQTAICAATVSSVSNSNRDLFR